MDDPKDIGTQLARELIDTLESVQRNSEKTREILVDLRDVLQEKVEVEEALTEGIEELCGRLQVISVAASIMEDITSQGGRLTLKDFAHAIVQAEREVFSEDEDGQDGDGDQPVAGDRDPSRGRA